VSHAGRGSLQEHSPATEDDGLVSRLQAGDHLAGALLYRRHRPGLRRYLLVILGDERDVDDLMHQTFVAVFDRIHSYTARGLPFERWLFAIARNAALKHRRDAQRTEVIDPATLDRDREREVEREAVAIESPTAGFDALTSTLSASQRRALLLLYGFDMTPDDAAIVLEQSPGSVRKAHARGITALAARRARLGL